MPIIIKNSEQIEGIRKSCELAAATLRFLQSSVEIGVSTQHLNDLAESYIRDHHAIPAPLNYHGFPKSICTSINEVICHGIPRDTEILKDGDIINIDVTTILDGYFGDTSTMFAVGEVAPKALELIEAARQCLDIGIRQVKPGNEFYKIGQAISELAHKQAYSVVYQYCGHGTGVEFHEEPQINHAFNPKQKDVRKMKAGMIFTIEPMINYGVSEAIIDSSDKWTVWTADGELSAQFEHTVLVTENGVDILTK